MPGWQVLAMSWAPDTVRVSGGRREIGDPPSHPQDAPLSASVSGFACPPRLRSTPASSGRPRRIRRGGSSATPWPRTRGRTPRRFRQTPRRSAGHSACSPAAALFMAQKLAVPGPPLPVERHARKRLQRVGWDRPQGVRVVRLRHLRTEEQGAEPAGADWPCRWIVRAHWRQHWFPSVQQHRPLYIAPHVKGPEDKPLKPPEATVFAVVR